MFEALAKKAVFKMTPVERNLQHLLEIFILLELPIHIFALHFYKAIFSNYYLVNFAITHRWHCRMTDILISFCFVTYFVHLYPIHLQGYRVLLL